MDWDDIKDDFDKSKTSIVSSNDDISINEDEKHKKQTNQNKRNKSNFLTPQDNYSAACRRVERQEGNTTKDCLQ